MKQEASGLTLIYFRTLVSGVASAGSAANYGAEGCAEASLGARVLATRGTAVHAVVTALGGWLKCVVELWRVGICPGMQPGGRGEGAAGRLVMLQ